MISLLLWIATAQAGFQPHTAWVLMFQEPGPVAILEISGNPEEQTCSAAVKEVLVGDEGLTGQTLDVPNLWFHDCSGTFAASLEVAGNPRTVRAISRTDAEREAVRTLAALFNDADERQRLRAAIDLLESEEWTLRRESVRLITSMRDPANFDLAAAALESADRDGRGALSSFFGRVNSPAAATQLIRMVASDPEQIMRQSAASNLAYHFRGLPAADAALRKAAEAGLHIQPDRYRAEEWLAESRLLHATDGIPAGTEHLSHPPLVNLEHPTPMHRLAMAEWLIAAGHTHRADPRFVALLSAMGGEDPEAWKDTVTTVLRPLAEAELPSAALRAVGALSDLHPEESAALHAGLLERPGCRADQRCLRTVITVLAVERQTRAAALQTLLEAVEAGVPQGVAVVEWTAAMAWLGDRDALEGRLATVSDGAIFRVERVEALLMASGHPKEVSYLIGLLPGGGVHHRDLTASWAAVRLGQLGDRRAIRPLFDAWVSTEKPSWFDQPVHEALLGLAGPDLIREMEVILEEDDSTRREAAARILMQTLPADAHLRLLREQWDDENCTFHAHIAREFGRVGRPEDIERLARRADYWTATDLDVQWAAINAIAEIRRRHGWDRNGRI